MNSAKKTMLHTINATTFLLLKPSLGDQAKCDINSKIINAT